MALSLQRQGKRGGEMARMDELDLEAARGVLFERLRAAKPGVVALTMRDTGIEATYLEPGFDRILELVAEPVPTHEQLGQWREAGMRLAREGQPTERVLDGLLSLNWAIWETVMRQDDLPREVALDFADRILRGLDDAVAAISQGYLQVEVEEAAAHSERRRAVIEELLTAPRSTPEDRARIRLRSERHGLAVAADYRLVLVHVPGKDEAELDRLIDALEKRVRAPAPHHRVRPGIRLPIVLDWRARVLVLTTAEWSGQQRLREALPAVLGDDIVVIDTGPVPGVEALADELAHAEYSATVAEALGRRGWIGEPGEMALETTFLLDVSLVRAAIRHELGPLLDDPRMGTELIETLEVYLGSRQNIRETARRLHLAPRTVAYRLERIETLLGHELDGEVAMRLGAAILALRVRQKAGREEREAAAATDAD
jgi:hypothetical protein